MTDRITAREVRDFILDQFPESLEASGHRPDDVQDDFDLLLEGVIDSLGLLELIASIEDQFEIELDFADLPAEDLTRIGPFSRFVAGFCSR
jgi:acyl carrier protein